MPYKDILYWCHFELTYVVSWCESREVDGLLDDGGIMVEGDTWPAELRVCVWVEGGGGRGGGGGEKEGQEKEKERTEEGGENCLI